MPRAKAKVVSNISEDVNEKILKIHHIPAYFLIFALVVAFYFLFVSLQPFFTVIIFAGVLATAFYPVYRRIFLGVNHSTLAAVLSCIIVTLIIVIPLVIIFFLLASEAVNAYASIQIKVNSGFFDPILKWKPGSFVYDAYRHYFPDLRLSDVDLSAQITTFAQTVSTFLIEQAQAFVSGIFGFFISFLIMTVTLFYFFKDGEHIAHRILELSPLPVKYEKRLLTHLHRMTKATLYGTFLTAIVQGVIGGIGFAIAGVEQPVLWGSVMAFFALLPYVGTGFVWLPASVILLATGHTGSAIFLFLWGVLIVGTIDNFLRPYLVGKGIITNSLLTFLVVLGGVIVWGFPGVVFGPLVLTMLTALLEIYEKEYGSVLKGLDHDGI